MSGSKGVVRCDAWMDGWMDGCGELFMLSEYVACIAGGSEYKGA